MEELGPAKPAPSVDELIAVCGKEIEKVMQSEAADELESGRIWILRGIFKAYLYYRRLQKFSPAIYQSFANVFSIMGNTDSEDVSDDYTQNVFKGYCRKLEAVVGLRMPNCVAVPDNAEDNDAVKGSVAANAAAYYINHKCGFDLKNLYLVFGLYNFGTMFWHIDWVEDGTKQVPDMQEQQHPLGDGGFVCPGCTASVPGDPQAPPACPQCGQQLQPGDYKPPTMTQVPQKVMKEVPKGRLDLTLHNASTVSVPLDATSIDDCDWLMLEREKSKARLLEKWGDKIRGGEGSDEMAMSSSSQRAFQIRSAMASPIGLVRTNRPNRWTERDLWWVPAQFQLIEDKAVRQMLMENFPSGLRITWARGKMVDLKEEVLSERWQETLPEPSTSIMADPLGDDFFEYQDIHNNLLNQRGQLIERSNLPGFGDPTRIDFDAWQNRQSTPAELFPALRPPGGSLGDVIYFPEPPRFSDQITPFRIECEDVAKNNSGLLDPIWGGGDAEEPTARQAELKKNAALMQLGVPWKFIGKSLEKVYLKACKLLAEYEDGVLALSKKNQFGKYDTVSTVVEDLKNDGYHFEADEAIPMTWGQMRDLIMWMMDKPEELLTLWGFKDPLNIVEFKQTLQMPGMRTPLFDDRQKGMDTISQLLEQEPQPGQPGPPDPMTGEPGQPGPPQPSIPPDWEDDHAFCAGLAKAYLVKNASLKTDNPDGYQNVVLWGQAHEQMANQPPPPPPPKTSVAVSVKGQELGSPAVQAMLNQEGILPQGVQVQPEPQVVMPPPGAGNPPIQ